MISAQKTICLAVELKVFTSSVADHTSTRQQLSLQKNPKSIGVPNPQSLPLKRASLRCGDLLVRCLDRRDGSTYTFLIRFWDSGHRKLQPLLPAQDFRSARQFDHASPSISEQQTLNRQHVHA